MTPTAERGGLSPDSLVVRPLAGTDGDWARSTLEAAWGSVHVARRAELVDASAFPGFVAVLDDDRVGLAVTVPGQEYEVLSLSSAVEGRGVGRALLARCFRDARERGSHRVWLTTTNDNIAAVALYQLAGMDLCALHHDAVTVARRLKPSIPLRDRRGVPIRHELEFELLLSR